MDIHRLGIHSIYQRIYAEDCRLSQILDSRERNSGYGNMLLFHESLLHYLSDPKMSLSKGIIDIIKAVDPFISTMAGLALNAFIIFKPGVIDQRKLLDLVTRWIAEQQSNKSPLKQVIYIILSRNLVFEDLVIPDIGRDSRINASLGCALARERKFDLAILLLEDALMKHRSVFRLVEFGYISAELVKCYNALQEDKKGEAFGKHALALLNPEANEVKMRTDLVYLRIALGDSLIAQGKYDEAKPILLSIIETEGLSARSTTITALRINKTNRRLQLEKGCTLGFAGPLGTALSNVEEAEAEVKLEFISEIGAAISQVDLDGHEDAFADSDVQTFLQATLQKFSKNEPMMTDWRLQTVNDHILDLPEVPAESPSQEAKPR